MGRSVDMNKIVGTYDILFVCLDSLRYDVAMQEEKAERTPVLNRYGVWEMRQASGNFTYPSHQAMFAGFFPCPAGAKSTAEREYLFFPKAVGLGKVPPPGSYGFSGSTIMEGLSNDGYETWCVGGVSFFDKRSDLGRVFPEYFMKSDWIPAFGCTVKESTKNQVDFILKKISAADRKGHIFLYLNVDAVHYPNYFYLEEADAKDSIKHKASLPRHKASRDSIESHAAALRYADGELGRLFDGWKEQRGDAFVICCSDHGTCYGEDGFWSHGINHPAVSTIPYKHFLL